MDSLSPEDRSRLMARIRRKDTKPEMVVRQLTHALGYRYRLHDQRLPGSPDLVFPSRQKVILVHGCFWHRHVGCRLAYFPKSNIEFWRTKFDANVQRDQRVIKELEEIGWDALVIWECETREIEALDSRLIGFLENKKEGDVHVDR
ncbi:very short patch repair endonuclease [Dyella ginsengisoli]|uniref:very short patch repair endonuclease n=1 Tax=Dyella ginsengisoli TaxID=363848 RepID=UPI00034CCF55|nr:DNA mismatch endonuclease Vsr [Dyella ginsengisoli]